jgi:rubrerythrin
VSDDIDNILNLLFEIELKTAEIYLSFHRSFMTDVEIARFWAEMAGEEINHASLVKDLKSLLDKRKDIFFPPSIFKRLMKEDILKDFLQKLDDWYLTVDKKPLALSSAVGIAMAIEDTFMERFNILSHIKDSSFRTTLAKLYGDSQRHREKLLKLTIEQGGVYS